MPGGLSPAARDLIQRRRQTLGPSAAAGPTPRDGSVAPLPTSFEQQNLWLFDRVSPGLAAYHIPLAMRVIGPIDVAALRSALGALVIRHESLRTTLVLADGAPVQVVGEPRPVSIREVDLRECPDERQQVELRRILGEEVGRPFDLARDLMLRGILVRLGDREQVLLLVAHHIAADGWSIGILAREFAALYESSANGERPTLAPLPIQYADFALWQRRRLQGEALEALVAFWGRYLEGAPDSLELPADRPRPPRPSFRGARHSVSLPQGLTGELKALSRGENVTLFMTLLAAFKVLLARYSGRKDLVVGSPVAGRDRVELEGLIGFFVNTLPLRTDLSGDPSFLELLGRVRRSFLDAFAHRDLPLAKLVEELRPGRSYGTTPFFQVVFALHNMEQPTFRLPGLALEPLDFDLDSAKFDLSVAVEERSDGLRVSFTYSEDLFDEATIRRMVGHYRRLLEGIVADPGRPIGRMPLLTEDERHRILVEWNDTARAYPADRCVHQLFEEQAARTPDAVAVVFEDRRLTYAELNARSNRLAHSLRDLGVGRETPVALCLDRSPEMVVGILGILKAGGAYVPIDPANPPARLRFMLDDTAVAAVVTERKFATLVPCGGIPTVLIDADHPDLPGRPAHDPPNLASADTLAYIMYTSGSTGEPKGVAIEHRSIVRLVHGTSYATFDAGRTFLQLAPIAFDASTFEIWGALLHGARLVIAPAGMPDLARLESVIRSQGVTTLWLTAGLFNEIVESRPRCLEGVAEILTGGEALSPRHVRLAYERLRPPPRIINGYGPTESTTFACCHPIAPERIDSTGSIPIGRPIANTRAYILDDSGDLVPVGVPGELFLGGDGLARGYLNRPEETAARFVASPFRPGERLYRTGDRVRWLEGGNIEFLGRIDGQVKLRGFRIELGEIEAALNRHEAVGQSVAMLREVARGGRRLVAYWVARGAAGRPEPAAEPRPDPEPDLAAYLRSHLPAYMIPSEFCRLTSIPLTSNGKVDRRALPEPTNTKGSASGDYTAPQTAAQQKLTALWAEALGRERIGIHENFFELGGHSLTATRLFTRIEAEFGRSIPLATLFHAQTVAEMTAILNEAGDPDPRPRTVTLRTGDGRRPPLFLVHGMGGDLLQWTRLIYHLGTDRMIHGLCLPLDDDGAPLFFDLESLAAHHVEQMLAHQPEGPYYVAGYSFGAMLALEIAQQLISGGHHVALLGVFDTSPFQNREGASHLVTFSRFTCNLYYWIIDDLLQTHPREMLERVRLKTRSLAKRIGIIPDSRPDSAPLIQLESWLDLGKLTDRNRRVFETNYLAFRRYVPRPYPGRITLFRARTRPIASRTFAPDLRWGEVALGGVDVRLVRGDHWSIMSDPHVRSLAEHVRESLNELS